MKDSVAYLRVHVSSPDAVCSFSYSEDGQHYKTSGKAFTAKQDNGWAQKSDCFVLPNLVKEQAVMLTWIGSGLQNDLQ
ncbi:MAG: hypothetical protein QM629_19735 [Parafilimonas sp.]